MIQLYYLSGNGSKRDSIGHTVYLIKKQKEMGGRPFTSVASTLARPEQVVVTTGEEIFLLQDGGEIFILVADRSVISHFCYFTSVAISEENPDEWIIGLNYRICLHLDKAKVKNEVFLL